MYNADRMKFIVATMTKDYEKARDIATKILKDEPDNTILQNYLSTFDKGEINKTMSMCCEKIEKSLEEKSTSFYSTDLSEYLILARTEKGIDEETDSTESAESSTESDSDSSQSTTDEDNERTVIAAKTSCRSFVEEKTSHDSSNRRNTEDNVDKLRQNDFRGKMIRVLPIRLSDKISVSK